MELIAIVLILNSNAYSKEETNKFLQETTAELSMKKANQLIGVMCKHKRDYDSIEQGLIKLATLTSSFSETNRTKIENRIKTEFGGCEKMSPSDEIFWPNH